ncbi:MAG: topoisomerase DNA-binding C4 zinc finger domain-containing protein [Bradymonadia bacterium]
MNASNQPLMIVESPRTAEVLRWRLGAPWKVGFTRGSLMEANELGWRPRVDRRSEIEALVEAAAEASDVYVATDDDREGEGIAGQVRWALRHTHSDLWRLRTPSVLDEPTLHEALADAKPLGADVGEKARWAHLVDRALSAELGQRLSSVGGSAPGRVQVAALGLMSGAFKDAWPIDERRSQQPLDTAGLWVATSRRQLETRAGHVVRHLGRPEVESITQHLYLKGLISYPRTRSTWMPPTYVEQARGVLSRHGTLRDSPLQAPASAHGALRPSWFDDTGPQGLRQLVSAPDAHTVLALIWSHTAACLAGPEHPWARWGIEPLDGPMGWGEIAGRLIWAGVSTPASVGASLTRVVHHGWVHGPSTSAEIRLSPAGGRIVDLLAAHCPEALTPALTARVETWLADPEVDHASALRWPHEVARSLLRWRVGVSPTPSPTSNDGVSCPDCGGSMSIRRGRRGQFWGCDDFPRCRGTAPLETPGRLSRQAPFSMACPHCEDGQVTPRRGRGGRWTYHCSNGARCDFFCRDRPVAVECPRCRHGYMVEYTPHARGTSRFVVRPSVHPDSPEQPTLSCPACRHRISRR